MVKDMVLRFSLKSKDILLENIYRGIIFIFQQIQILSSTKPLLTYPKTPSLPL